MRGLVAVAVLAVAASAAAQEDLDTSIAKSRFQLG
jgi:hypothetical protein